MLPSASVGDRSGPGVFEPCHGSAPDIAGQVRQAEVETVAQSKGGLWVVGLCGGGGSGEARLWGGALVGGAAGLGGKRDLGLRVVGGVGVETQGAVGRGDDTWWGASQGTW